MSDSRIASSRVGDPSAASFSSAERLSKHSEVALVNTAARKFSRVAGGKESITTSGGGHRRGVSGGGGLASPTDWLGDATVTCSMALHAPCGRTPVPASRQPFSKMAVGAVVANGSRNLQ